jgi:2-methylisocitrate lyase-like PEP mutase family enzyme
LEPRGLRSVHRARHDLVALHRRANAVRAAIPDAALARFVVVSNTSAYLNETALAEAFDLAETVARLPQVTNATARTNLP